MSQSFQRRREGTRALAAQGSEIPPMGQGPLYIVGEAPGQAEERAGMPFVGASGNLLFRVLGRLGVPRGKCRIANRYWRRPPGNEIGKVKGTEDWDRYGRMVIEDVLASQPKVLLLLGNEALRLFFPDLSVSHVRGYWLEWNGIPVMATYHPAAVLRQDTFMLPFRMDLQKVAMVLGGMRRPLQTRMPELRVQDKEKWMEVAEGILEGRWDRWSLDIEVQQKPRWRCHIIGIAVEGLAVNVEPDGDVVEMLKRLAWERWDGCVLHNAAFDLMWLWGEYGVEFGGPPHDTMVMHHVLLADQPKSLEFCASLYLDVPAWKWMRKEDEWTYNALDCAITWMLWERIKEELEKRGWWDVYDGQKRRELEPAVFMGHLGLRLDRVAQQEMKDEVLGRMEEIGAELVKESGPINLNSPKQLKDLLYVKWGLPVQRHKGKPSVREDAIQELIRHRKVPEERKEWLRKYLEWKKLRSILSKELAVEPCGWTGCVHTAYNVAGTESARWSSSEPLWGGGANLQNRSKPYRRMYLPRFEGWVFVSADYGGAEARIVAWRCNDEVAKRAFLEGRDIHKLTASMMFGIPEEEVSKDLRQIGKRIRHAANYGMSWKTLSKVMGISASQAKELLERYHRVYPKVREVFHARTRELLLKQGYLLDAWGLPRVFTGRLNDEATFREAYSFYPQSTCTHTLNRALLVLWERYKEDEEVAVNLQIHDELVLICRPERVAEVIRAMDEAMGMEIPILDLEREVVEPLVLPREFKVGWNWGEYDPERNPWGMRELSEEELQDFSVEKEMALRKGELQ